MDSLLQRPEVQHYIHRAVQHAIRHPDRVEHVGLLSELSTLFPEAVEQFTKTELPYLYSYSDIEHAVSAKREGRSKHKRASTTPDELFSYTPRNIPATFRGSQVKLTDLVPASYQVADEISTTERKIAHETVRGASRGGEQREVARLGHPRFSHGVKLKRSKSEERATILQAAAKRPLLKPILSSSVDDTHFHRLTSETLFPSSVSPSKAAMSCRHVPTAEQLNLRNAYQAIEAFATGQLKSESESIYLNYANHWRQNPYNLVVVPKTRADPEHFVISKFGILCVYPDGTSDLQSFAEWLREASLFQLLRHIPFLKYYRLKKAFVQWYQNIRFAHYAAVWSKFRHIGMRYFDTFAEAILKINNLSQELLSIQFHSLQPLGMYPSDAYMHCLKGSQTKFQQFLHRYFKYCRRIVNNVVESTQNHAAELESELKHKPFVSDLPLSVQKEKQQQLAGNLEEMKNHAGRLSDFVGLAEHIVFSCLLEVAREGAQGWVNTTLGQLAHKKSESWNGDVYGQSTAVRSGSSIATSSLSDVLTEEEVITSTSDGASAILCVSIIIQESGIL